MFKPNEYIEQLIKNKGAGLTPADKAIYDKMMETDLQMAATEKQRSQLQDALSKNSQQLQQLQGRGNVLAELLYETYKQNMQPKLAPPLPAPSDDVAEELSQLKVPTTTN
jgi:hypothetical protein